MLYLVFVLAFSQRTSQRAVPSIFIKGVLNFDGLSEDHSKSWRYLFCILTVSNKIRFAIEN